MSCVYLYAIIDDPPTGEFAASTCGLDGASPVQLVARDGIGCVVSGHTAGDFRRLPREQLLRRLLAHQQVVEHVMHGRTVLPVKFGTTLDSHEDVRALLAQARYDLGKALGLMRGKMEIEVAATWDIQQVLATVGREEEVARARESLARKSSLTLEDRVGLGQLVRACLERRRNAYRARMLSVLRPLAIAVAPNALMSDQMVMNVAFLVDGGLQAEFESQVHGLDRFFHNEITFRVVGPLPPYSFGTVEVGKYTADEVEEARRALGLAGAVTEPEVRRAYRRLAAEEQRQSPFQKEALGSRVPALRRASEVLLACCRSQKGHVGPGHHPVYAVSVKGTSYREVEASRFGAAAAV